MILFNNLFTTVPYPDFPQQVLGWLGLLGFAALLALAVVRVIPRQAISLRQWAWVAVLVAFTPLAAMLLNVRVPGSEVLPLPNLPGESSAPILRPLNALPWVLAAGLIGPIPGLLVGLATGLVGSLWGTHSLLTVLEYGAMALVFGLAVHQPYRTFIFRQVRNPIGAALLVVVSFLPVALLSAFFSVNGELAVRFDFALTQNWTSLGIRLLEILLAGLMVQFVAWLRPQVWPRPSAPQLSPFETNLSARFLALMIPVMVILLFTLIVADWVVVGNAARDMIEGRMNSTAQVAAEGLPYFIESGQTLLYSMSSSDLLGQSPAELNANLERQLRSVPFFRQLFVFDARGEPVGGSPVEQMDQLRLSEVEKSGIEAALNGVLIQTYTSQPWLESRTAQVTFLTAIQDPSGNVRGVLLGRTDLDSNPFTQPAIQALETIQSMSGGEALILDENNKILYHSVPDSTLVDTIYTGNLPAESSFYDDVSSTGTRQLVYLQRTNGRPWSVVLTIPALYAQETALQNAMPLLVLLASFTLLITLVLVLGLRNITAYLQTLSTQTALIAQGQLDTPLAVQGEDEAGRLARTFEKMRLALKARLLELNRLLQVSQGVASHLEVSEALGPVMTAALGEDAVAARFVLIPDVRIDIQGGRRVSFGSGPQAEAFAHLDGQIFDLMRTETVVPIPNVARMRRLSLPPGKPYPAALIALALRSEDQYFGALWVAYDSPRSFTEEQVRFLTTLASESALAAANARLYATAEVGRQRIEAVLVSTPEPVLVFDEQDRLLLFNAAAAEVPELLTAAAPGKSVAEVVSALELKNLLALPVKSGLQSREITLANQRIYYASVSPVIAGSVSVGKVCILRDITHFKELDSLKSDFVNTVSHDLRSPLTLMRGYATMLKMVGELNDQQTNYVGKIIGGVDHMTLLVGNLLDLGRIEAGIGLRAEKINPLEVVDSVIHSAQAKAAQKNIQIQCETVGDNPSQVEADPVLLRQAINNLMENALKFTRVGGQVKVRSTWKSESIQFEVTDNGIGIAPLDLPRVFEKFYRSGQREAYQERGTGLGLAIVRSIAERHGGKAWAESQLGKGSSFFIEIPFQQSRKTLV